MKKETLPAERHPSVSEETARLLRETMDAIAADAQNFIMYGFVELKRDGRDEICGTVCCIVGRRAILDNAVQITDASRPDFLGGFDFEEFAQDRFKTTFEQGETLFYLQGWPERFMVSYQAAVMAGDNPGRVQAARNRVEHFIRTGE